MWQSIERKLDKFKISPYASLGINESATNDMNFVTNGLLITVLMASAFYISTVMIVDLVFFSSHENNRDINTLSLMLQAILIFIKFSLILVNSEKYKRIRTQCNQLQNTFNAEEKEIVGKGLKFSDNFLKFQLILAYGLLFYYLFRPLLGALFLYLRTHQLQFLMAPFPGYYPYETKEFLSFSISFIISTNYMYFAVNAIVAVDFLFFWYIQFCIGCYKILRRRIRSYSENEHQSQVALTGLSKAAWRDIIKFHNELLTIIGGINEVFDIISLCQVMTQIFLLCLNAVVVVYSTSFVQQVILAATSLLFMGSFLIYCVGGQFISNQGEKLADELYMSLPWHLFEPQQKHSVLIAMSCSQKPATITAFFFRVDHALITWVLQTTGSFTAALVALRE